MKYFTTIDNKKYMLCSKYQDDYDTNRIETKILSDSDLDTFISELFQISGVNPFITIDTTWGVVIGVNNFELVVFSPETARGMDTRVLKKLLKYDVSLSTQVETIIKMVLQLDNETQLKIEML